MRNIISSVARVYVCNSKRARSERGERNRRSISKTTHSERGGLTLS